MWESLLPLRGLEPWGQEKGNEGNHNALICKKSMRGGGGARG